MMFLSLLLIGCADDDFVLLSGSTSSDDGVILGDVDITAFDFGLMQTGETTSDGDGAFSVDVRSGGIFYLEMAGPDHVPTGFTGSIGQSDFSVGEGPIWLRSDAEMAALRSDFAGCPGADADSAAIEGEIRLFIQGQPEDEASRSYTGWAIAIDSDGVEHEACYLADDETRVVYDPEATVTGYHGRFALFDAPTGPVTMEIGYYIEDIPFYVTYYYVFVPEKGVTPMYPAWVELY